MYKGKKKAVQSQLKALINWYFDLSEEVTDERPIDLYVDDWIVRKNIRTKKIKESALKTG